MGQGTDICTLTKPIPQPWVWWVGGGFFHREMMACSLSCVEPSLCPVNMGTLVSGNLEYDGVCM